MSDVYRGKKVTQQVIPQEDIIPVAPDPNDIPHCAQ